MQSAAAKIVDDIYAVRRAQDREFARLGGIAPSLDQQRQMAEAAAQLRELYQDLELNLPRPGPTDRPADFQLKLLKPLVRFSPDWRRADIGELAKRGALAGIDRAIISDALRVARDKTVGSIIRAGALRPIRRVDQAGVESISFHGPSPLVWMRQWMPPMVTQIESFGRTR